MLSYTWATALSSPATQASAFFNFSLSGFEMSVKNLSLVISKTYSSRIEKHRSYDTFKKSPLSLLSLRDPPHAMFTLDVHCQLSHKVMKHVRYRHSAIDFRIASGAHHPQDGRCHSTNDPAGEPWTCTPNCVQDDRLSLLQLPAHFLCVARSWVCHHHAVCGRAQSHRCVRWHHEDR